MWSRTNRYVQHLSLTFLHFIPPSVSPSHLSSQVVWRTRSYGFLSARRLVALRESGGGLVLPSALLHSHSFMNVTSVCRSRWNLQTLSRELGEREKRGMSEGLRRERTSDSFHPYPSDHLQIWGPGLTTPVFDFYSACLSLFFCFCMDAILWNQVMEFHWDCLRILFLFFVGSVFF